MSLPGVDDILEVRPTGNEFAFTNSTADFFREMAIRGGSAAGFANTEASFETNPNNPRYAQARAARDAANTQQILQATNTANQLNNTLNNNWTQSAQLALNNLISIANNPLATRLEQAEAIRDFRIELYEILQQDETFQSLTPEQQAAFIESNSVERIAEISGMTVEEVNDWLEDIAQDPEAARVLTASVTSYFKTQIITEETYNNTAAAANTINTDIDHDAIIAQQNAAIRAIEEDIAAKEALLQGEFSDPRLRSLITPQIADLTEQADRLRTQLTDYETAYATHQATLVRQSATAAAVNQLGLDLSEMYPDGIMPSGGLNNIISAEITPEMRMTILTDEYLDATTRAAEAEAARDRAAAVIAGEAEPETSAQAAERWMSERHELMIESVIRTSGGDITRERMEGFLNDLGTPPDPGIMNEVLTLIEQRFDITLQSEEAETGILVGEIDVEDIAPAPDTARLVFDANRAAIEAMVAEGHGIPQTDLEARLEEMGIAPGPAMEWAVAEAASINGANISPLASTPIIQHVTVASDSQPTITAAFEAASVAPEAGTELTPQGPAANASSNRDALTRANPQLLHALHAILHPLHPSSHERTH